MANFRLWILLQPSDFGEQSKQFAKWIQYEDWQSWSRDHVVQQKLALIKVNLFVSQKLN